MALPTPPNTTCDIYRSASSPPPSNPDVAGVKCYLYPKFSAGHHGRNMSGMQMGVTGAVGSLYTHIMNVDYATDIRDAYADGTFALARDVVYVPNKSSKSLFYVMFVERVNRGGNLDYKRVYLRRGTVTWPSNDL